MDLYVSSGPEQTYVAFRYTTHIDMPVIQTANGVSITLYLRSGDWTSDEWHFGKSLTSQFISKATLTIIKTLINQTL
jgi:hypothetical protein